MKVTNQIDQKQSLKEITQNIRDIPVPISHLEIVEFLARKYGTLKTALDIECDTKMVQFACQQSRVLAIIADDSNFLIFAGNWRYFSLRDLDHKTLMTKEYNRKALRENLELNDQELVLLSTLNGNDVISFDRDTFYFHKSLIEDRFSASERFPAITKYIKENQLFSSDNLYVDIAKRIFLWKFKTDVEGYTRKVRDSFDFYNIVSLLHKFFNCLFNREILQIIFFFL